jgi:hypothetical protein
MQQFGKNRVRSQIIHFDAYPTWIATSDVNRWLTSIWRAPRVKTYRYILYTVVYWYPYFQCPVGFGLTTSTGIAIPDLY